MKSIWPRSNGCSPPSTSGDTELANQIDLNETDPVFDMIEDQVYTAARNSRAQAVQHLDGLARLHTGLLIATPIVFAFAVGLVMFFWSVLANLPPWCAPSSAARSCCGPAERTPLPSAHPECLGRHTHLRRKRPDCLPKPGCRNRLGLRKRRPHRTIPAGTCPRRRPKRARRAVAAAARQRRTPTRHIPHHGTDDGRPNRHLAQHPTRPHQPAPGALCRRHRRHHPRYRRTQGLRTTTDAESVLRPR